MSLLQLFVVYQCGALNPLQEVNNLYHSISHALGLNKEYREDSMEDQALKDVLEDRRIYENLKLKELETMIAKRYCCLSLSIENLNFSFQNISTNMPSES